jgi:hypothetical protein
MLHSRWTLFPFLGSGISALSLSAPSTSYIHTHTHTATVVTAIISSFFLFRFVCVLEREKKRLVDSSICFPTVCVNLVWKVCWHRTGTTWTTLFFFFLLSSEHPHLVFFLAGFPV